GGVNSNQIQPKWPLSDGEINSLRNTYDDIQRQGAVGRRQQADLATRAQRFNDSVDRGNQGIATIESELQDARKRRNQEVQSRRRDIENQYDTSNYNLCPNGAAWASCDHPEEKAEWLRRKAAALARADQGSTSADADIARLEGERQRLRSRMDSLARD